MGAWNDLIYLDDEQVTYWYELRNFFFSALGSDDGNNRGSFDKGEEIQDTEKDFYWPLVIKAYVL